MTKVEQLYTTYIRTTPEKLWNAITNPEFTKQYWGGANLSDWKKGSKWQLVLNEEKTPKIIGQVLESVPPKRLVLSWAAPDDTSAASEHSCVTFEIEPIAGMVRLNVIHGNLEAGGEMHRGISEGWPRVLSSLKSFLETGQALDVKAGKSCNVPKVAATS